MTLHHLADNTDDDHTCDHRQRHTRRRFRLNPGYDDRTLAPVEDAELLRRVNTQDRRALEVLYQRHAGWLQIRLERRCGDPDLADLALQDTFISVWRNSSKWRGDGEVAAWMWGIAIRRLVDHQRKAGRRPSSVSLQHGSMQESKVQSQDPSLSPEYTVVAAAVTAEVTAALAELPQDLSDVMIATTVDGLTNAQAAVLLAIPVGTLKTRARKARKLLAHSLNKAPQDGTSS